MAARKCEHQVRKTVLSKIPGWQAIRDNANQTILGPIDPQPYSDELSSFNKLVDKEVIVINLVPVPLAYELPLSTRFHLRCLKQKRL